ncbi:MAG: hypothetical protein GTN84_09570 [Hydrogenophaga sp.]|uniref:hypothetical protein n=1 Tax=Hydrogenophaga sp. TaxID=1904254 RepID=UPI001690A663|nr:hypothetical protein [Hydrogenophaga sp.]NIM41341.1 hypothetical protein [Hydrogenophaga sp.]NIN26657.1 hypothetical protein [Hydrogenophaga sp.]NIN29979.1 hypothetical protein [Hydrogenophaga sp.]NIN55587.1 hypothetical protein [Hydrogenophaga sp.]NIO52584.1 hypothetical protein [Hydrogenophaga sp.]
MLKQLVFSFVFFWPGWLVVKMITFGRYPRSIHPAKADWLDYELLSFIGVIAVAGAIFLVACLWL